ncbi:MAG: hypothetical protein Q9217_005577 [Psora testacea]
MYPFGFNDLSDSPVTVSSPHQHQFHAISRAAHSLYRPSARPIMDSRPYDIPLVANHAKKRSRDEVGAAETEAIDGQIPPAATPFTSPKEGTGIPMRQTNLDILQHMQSPSDFGVAGIAGTYVEEPILQVDVPSSASQSEEDLPRRKILRHAAITDIGGNDKPDDSNTPPTNESKEVDEYARLLGIGWAAPGDDSAGVASMRGFHRFIENNFSLTNVKIVAQHKKELVNLVQAAQGWFAFTDDLRRGQRLAGTKDQAIVNLKENPVKFEGKSMAYHERAAALSNTPSPPGSTTERKSTDTDECMVVGRMDID